jgi:type I restriction enzyme R subunit
MNTGETEADSRKPYRSGATRCRLGRGRRRARPTRTDLSRPHPGGQRGTALSADYVLSYRGRNLVVIEAKKAGLGHTTGVGQTRDCAGRLMTRFAYASNAIGWCGIDMHSGA